MYLKLVITTGYLFELMENRINIPVPALYQPITCGKDLFLFQWLSPLDIIRKTVKTVSSG